MYATNRFIHMTSIIAKKETLTLEALVLQYGPIELQSALSRETFVALAERYPDLRMERETNGTTTIMSPVKKGSGRRESWVHGLLFMWNYQTGLGEVYSPSTGFDLPSGATKCSDGAWISLERLAESPADDEERFVTIVPDFVAEVRSGTDRLKKLQTKMTDTWLGNGVRLAWLIDPYKEKVYIYRPDQEVEVVAGFADKVLSGGEIMPGFELPLDKMRRRI